MAVILPGDEVALYIPYADSVSYMFLVINDVFHTIEG